jgi:hypothetical protein
LKIAFALLSILLAAIQLAAQDSQLPQSSANANQSSPAPDVQEQKSKAAVQLQQQEHQRILGIMPNFNTSNIHNAAPLSPEQKFQLAPIEASASPSSAHSQLLPKARLELYLWSFGRMYRKSSSRIAVAKTCPEAVPALP